LGTTKFGFWDHVIDIFANVGLKKPEISILSEEFLTDMSGMLQKNLAIELLRELLKEEIKNLVKKHLVQTCSFAEMCDVVFNTFDEDGNKVLCPVGGTPQFAKQIAGGLLMMPWTVRGENAHPDQARQGRRTHLRRAFLNAI
jgi:hypothetical protein